jgi:hypothetical protein
MVAGVMWDRTSFFVDCTVEYAPHSGTKWGREIHFNDNYCAFVGWML